MAGGDIDKVAEGGVRGTRRAGVGATSRRNFWATVESLDFLLGVMGDTGEFCTE